MAIQNALDARRQRIVLSGSSVNSVKGGRCWAPAQQGQAAVAALAMLSTLG